MLIGEFCRATGLGRDTVRFYVRRGLLTPALGSRPGNRYQVFSAEQVERARLIRQAQAVGFTLKEIAALAAAYERSGLPRDERIALLRARVAQLDAQARQLRGMRRYLMAKIDWLKAGEVGAPPPAPGAAASPAGGRRRGPA